MEPKIELVEMYRCPVCGQIFLKRDHYDRHARGCAKVRTILGQCVRWFEGSDAHSVEYRGRVVDVYYPDPDVDLYALEDNDDPITVMVTGFRKDSKNMEMGDYELNPDKLEIIHREDFENWYVGIAMRQARRELDGIRKEAENNMSIVGLTEVAKQEEKE